MAALQDRRSNDSTSWADHAVFWHLYPLGFTGAEREAPGVGGNRPLAHRLQHIEAWLDYAVELGCSALQLGPVFASHTHGYDTLDYFRIDPRLGDEADFDRLVAAVHGKGMQLALDGVFNHVGRGFAQLRDVVERGEHSPHARWFRRTGPGREDFATFEGHHQLVALNHDEPEVAEWVARVMQHWLGRGVNGFRLDAAYAVAPRFWQRVLPAVRREHPHAWFVGEVIHGDYANIVADSGLDCVTQYELWKAVWSAINDQNFFELAWALERHAGFVRQFLPLTFIGNHDVTRIASRIRDERHLAHAIVALLTLPGVPSIYAGDEQAFRGVKEQRAGGDDAIRPEFPPAPEQLAPYGWPIYRLHQNLIGLRRRHRFLQRARLHIETRTNPALIYRCEGDDQALSVVLNVGDAAVPVPGSARHLLSSQGTQPATRFESLEVEPHGWLICQRPKQTA